MKGLVLADGLAQGARRFLADAGFRPSVELDRHVGRSQDVEKEPGHVVAAADGGAHGFQFRGDRLGLDGVLGEPGAAGLLPVPGVLPLDVQVLFLRVEAVDEVERELAGALLVAEQGSLEQGLRDLLAGAGHRHGHPEIALDALVLADQHVEDHPVDRVVGAVVGDDPHLGGLLPEAVHPPFPLLVPGGIPGQVVVQDGIEVFLEIDSLREAVGADQDKSSPVSGQRTLCAPHAPREGAVR